MDNIHQTRLLLIKMLKERFSMQEIGEIATQLYIDWDDLEGTTKTAKAQELVTYLDRRHRVEELKAAIIRLRPDIRAELVNSSYVIPVVVAAMNSAEAADLADESIFQTTPVIGSRPVSWRGPEYESKLYQDIVSELPNEVFANYKINRDDWTPYPDMQIGQIIETVAGAGKTTYRPLFFSEEIFSENREVRSRTAENLQLYGCILIIDSVSLFHPKIKYLLKSSGLLTNRPSVITLVLSPLDHTNNSFNRYIETIFRDSDSLSVIVTRFEALDILCEFGIGGARPFKRWLYSILPRAAEVVNNEIAQSDKIDRLQGVLGVTGSSGISSKIFGGSSRGPL